MPRRLALSLAVSSLAACSTPTTNTPDDTDETDDTVIKDTFNVGDTDETQVDTDDTLVVDTDDGIGGSNTPCSSSVPVGLEHGCDFSVNNAVVDLPEPGDDAVTLRVQLSSTNPTGSFTGSGRGNLAIYGLDRYNRRAMSNFTGVIFDADPVGSTNLDLEFHLQVDLQCDGTEFALLYVDGANYITSTVNGHTRHTALPGDNIWSAYGGLEDPTSPGTKLLYQAGDPMGAPASLATFNALFPDACVRNFDGEFRDMPNNTAVSGVLFTMGSATNPQFTATWKLYRVEIFNNVHLPPE